MSKILVVEDDSMLLDLIMEILSGSGFRPVGAANGKEALEVLKSQGADLILCDVLMPVMDGYELLKKVRGSTANYIPFILLTGKAERADFRRGMELGADDFIPKPFTEEELLGAVLAQMKKWSSLGVPNFPQRTVFTGLPERLGPEDHILLTADSQPKILKVNDLKCIAALGDYTSVFTSEGKFIVRRPMKEWEEMLPKKYFIRIHRSTIINVDFVDKIEKLLKGSYKVYLHNIPKPFIISRRYRSRFKEKFS
ncbi:MAG TPA: LytTR family DNA-binding domain-containing protein [Ignavibacteriales bacterium]|nr:LytTR family DNA-binding domain-containing protein [Ignavibacteriales bacterium]